MTVLDQGGHTDRGHRRGVGMTQIYPDRARAKAERRA